VEHGESSALRALPAWREKARRKAKEYTKKSRKKNVESLLLV
jgi:hypothetical protein